MRYQVSGVSVSPAHGKAHYTLPIADSLFGFRSCNFGFLFGSCFWILVI